jgi:DNA-binding CsgD family transcriptional regulator
VFVGRAVELARLDDALRAAAGGEGGAVVVGGEAGVGKTRLVTELASRATAAGFTVLCGGCVDLDGAGPPLAPVVEALRGLARRSGPGTLARLAGHRRAELGWLLPELGAAGDPGVGEGATPGRLFDLVLGVIETLAAQAPVLVVLEDLHWADPSTRALAAFLLRNVRGSRVLLTLTYRSDGVGPGHPLRGFLAEAERLRWTGTDRPRFVERVELDRFGRAEIAELVGAILGGPPPDGLVAAVAERSEGNAFFIEELVAAAEDDGLPAAVSATLREALLSRVEALPAASGQLLRVAATGGQHVEHRLLTAVAGLPDEQVWEALRAAVDAGVLLADPGGDAYVFRHALTREALRHEALPGELVHLHRRYAQVIEDDPSLVGGGARATVALAHHWFAAGEHARALPALLSAARSAACACAHAEALARYECALASWEEVPDAAERAGADLLSVLEAATVAARTAGDMRAGLALAERAHAEAVRVGDPVRLALVLTELGKLRSWFGVTDGFTEAWAAADLVPPSPPTPERAQVLLALGRALAEVPRVAEADRVLAEALAVARATGARRVEAAALLSATCLTVNGQRPDDVHAGRAIAAEVGDDDLLLQSYTNESDTWLGRYRFEDAIVAGKEGRRLARRFGAERGHHGMLIAGNVVEALFGAGRWDEAERLLAEAADVELSGIRGMFLEQLRAELALARDRWDDALAALVVAERLRADRFFSSQLVLPLARVRAEIDLRRGDPATLTRITAALDGFEVPDVARYAAPLLATAMAAAATAADAARAARDQPGVGRALAGAARIAQLAATVPFTEITAGEALRAVVAGEQARALGRADPRAWATAAAAWADLGVPYQRARALRGRAEALLAVGDRPAAIRAARSAVELADDLGAHLLRRELGELALTGGFTLPADHGPGAPPPDERGAAVHAALGLTARELEVLRFVADGASNPQIASELVISRKTASTHVSNILAKLGVATRGEAAALAHRLRLFDEAGSLAAPAR